MPVARGARLGVSLAVGLAVFCVIQSAVDQLAYHWCARAAGSMRSNRCVRFEHSCPEVRNLIGLLLLADPPDPEKSGRNGSPGPERVNNEDAEPAVQDPPSTVDLPALPAGQ